MGIRNLPEGQLPSTDAEACQPCGDLHLGTQANIELYSNHFMRTRPSNLCVLLALLVHMAVHMCLVVELLLLRHRMHCLLRDLLHFGYSLLVGLLLSVPNFNLNPIFYEY